MWKVTLFMTGLAILSSTHARPAFSQSSGTPKAKNTVPRETHSAQRLEELTNKLHELGGSINSLQAPVSRIVAIEGSVQDLKAQSQKTDRTGAWISALSALIGAIIGAGVSFLQQARSIRTQADIARSNEKHARELAEARARLEIGDAVVKWQITQLSELYGPLRALLQQTHALYRQMNQALIASDSSRFQLINNSTDTDPDNREFQMFISGSWVRFRTVFYLHEVYGKNHGVDDYFDEIVAIGSRMVAIIQQRAGLARPEQSRLSDVFGRYLAHFAVLRRLHELCKKKRDRTSNQEPSEMKVDKSAVFPQELHGLVDDGFNHIATEILAWRAKATEIKSS